MLKSHFKHSQFIIVSLKEGMFNNANVVFRTRFVDGVSTVTRHVNPRAVLQSEDSVRKTTTAKKSTAAAPHPAKKSKKGIQASTWLQLEFQHNSIVINIAKRGDNIV